jgi:hypothetical protein
MVDPMPVCALAPNYKKHAHTTTLRDRTRTRQAHMRIRPLCMLAPTANHTTHDYQVHHV